MTEIKSKLEVSEVEKPTVENYKGIKPQEGMTPKEAKGFWDERFKNIEPPSEEIPKDIVEDVDDHVFYKDRLDKTPAEGTDRGSWTGERGESKFIPSESTEAGKKAKEKLAEKGLDGIKYKDAEPDFSECAEATVEIDNMTSDRPSNFLQAFEKCAEQWNTIQKDERTDWTAAEVRDWCRDNKISPHERCDRRTMDLVSYDIHSFFRHSGGCAECKAREPDKSKLGGGFDE